MDGWKRNGCQVDVDALSDVRTTSATTCSSDSQSVNRCAQRSTTANAHSGPLRQMRAHVVTTQEWRTCCEETTGSAQLTGANE
jgi:hypothetical protein